MSSNVLKIVITLLLASLCFLGFFAWKRDKEKKEEELKVGLASARVLSETFVNVRNITVGTLRGTATTRTTATSGPFGAIDNWQITKAPFTVDYFVSLKSLPLNAFRWDRVSQTMSVDIPEITVGEPNVDMTHADIKQGGIYIGRAASVKMNRDAAVRLNRVARATSLSSKNLNAARDNVRGTVEQLVKLPLAAAGLPSVRVVVRLPGEAAPRNVDRERWDESRSISDILAELR